MSNETKPTETPTAKTTYGREIHKRLGDRLLREADTIPADDALKLVEVMERALKMG